MHLQLLHKDAAADQLRHASHQGEAEGQGEGEGERRALEDEPLLAARMVVEDCMCLLLDVDDIDRLWAAGSFPQLLPLFIITAAAGSGCSEMLYSRFLCQAGCHL